MADVNYSLMLGLSKDRVRGLCVLTVRYPQQPFKNYVAYSKQPIHHHPKWLQEKIQTSSPNFVKHTEIIQALNIYTVWSVLFERFVSVYVLRQPASYWSR